MSILNLYLLVSCRAAIKFDIKIGIVIGTIVVVVVRLVI